MSGREHSIPAVRVSSVTNIQGGNFTDVSMGYIRYNTSDRQLQVYHHESGQLPGWQNVILAPHLSGNDKLRIELYRNNGTTQTITGGGNFKYLTYNSKSLIRGNPNDINYQLDQGLYKSSIQNNTNGRKRFFFRCFTGHATGGTYFDFIAYSNQYSSASYLNYTVGHNTIRGTGPANTNGVRKLIAGTTGTHDSMNIGQQLMDLNNGNSSLDRRAITGVIEVEPYHYIHIQVRKNGSQSVVGLSSNFRADCYGLLYFFEL